MKLITFLIIVTLLSGCATTETFENRLMCSLQRDEAIINSKWWKFGFALDLAKKDAVKACGGL